MNGRYLFLTIIFDRRCERRRVWRRAAGIFAFACSSSATELIICSFRSIPGLCKRTLRVQMKRTYPSSPTARTRKALTFYHCNREHNSEDSSDSSSEIGRFTTTVYSNGPSYARTDVPSTFVSPGPDVDPSKLCLWCDQPLPDTISSTLKALMDHARERSLEDERPQNRLGLIAPVNVASSACARHRFERNLLPLAEAHGWPQVINWRETYTRLQNLKPLLQAILDDADVDWKARTQPTTDKTPGAYDSDNEYDDERRVHPRWGSIFWKRLLKDGHASSILHVTGLRGQMGRFSLSAPG